MRKGILLLIGFMLACGQVPVATDSSQTQGGGRIAFLGGGNYENLVIQLMYSNGSGRVTIMPDADPRSDFFGPGWSPDGLQLVFSSNLGGNANHDIYIMNLDGSGLRRIVDDSGGDFAPAWSPGGQQIAFQAKRDTGWHWDIFSIDTASLEERNLTRTPDVDEEVPIWSPDGKQIVFQVSHLGRSNVFVMNADGSNRRQVTQGPSGVANETPAWSPDGSRIAFASNRHQNLSLEINNTLAAYDIYTIRPDGSDLQRITFASDSVHAVRWPSWSPDGQQLVAEMVELMPRTIQRRWYFVTFNSDGSNLREISMALGGRVPRWSPK